MSAHKLTVTRIAVVTANSAAWCWAPAVVTIRRNKDVKERTRDLPLALIKQPRNKALQIIAKGLLSSSLSLQKRLSIDADGSIGSAPQNTNFYSLHTGRILTMSETIHASNQTFTAPYLKIRGHNNTVCGAYCEMTGNNNTISGAYCTVYGNNNVLNGSFNRVVGSNNLLTGVGNTAEGEHNVTREATEGTTSTTYVNGTPVEGMNEIFAQFGNIFAGTAPASSSTATHFGNGTTIHIGGRQFSISGNPRYRLSRDNLLFTSWNENDRVTENGTTMTIDEWNQTQAFAPASNSQNQDSPSVTVDNHRTSSNRRTFATTTNLSANLYVKCPSVAEQEHDRDPALGGPTCIICHENAPICIAMPCMHMSFCVACSRSMCCDAHGQPKRRGRVACAKCRQDVHSVARVFVE